MTRRGDWWPVLDADTFAAPRDLDVLIPTRERPVELAATLAGLASTRVEEIGGSDGVGVAISDQSDVPVWTHPAVASMVRVLAYRGFAVHLAHNVTARGVVQQRALLLARSRARYVLCLDDDVWLEPDALARMRTAIEKLRCGMVGNAVHGLSFYSDVRRDQQVYQEWVVPPRPERIRPGETAWRRAQLHSAANLAHVTQRLALADGQWRAYKIAWISACVLYDRAKLLHSGGFDFWHKVPAAHCGEDVAAQLQVMERYGGAGIMPSGAYHLESDTTITERAVQCY